MMICPYCGIGTNIDWEEKTYVLNGDGDNAYSIMGGYCPVCERFVVRLRHAECYFNWITPDYPGELNTEGCDLDIQIFPTFASSHLLDDSIPSKYKAIFQEAEATLAISPRSSATLSRYLLQLILHEHLNIHKNNLYDEIMELEKRTEMPSPFIKKLHILRSVANFGAHPKKSTNSNEIIDVEPGEAEVILNLLIDFFDVLFVKPHQQTLFEEEIKSKYNISLD